MTYDKSTSQPVNAWIVSTTHFLLNDRIYVYVQYVYIYDYQA